MHKPRLAKTIPSQKPTHHGRMEYKLNSKEKHNIGRMASPSNPSAKLKTHHEKSMAKPYLNERISLSILEEYFVDPYKKRISIS
jgi:hypothetical protein